MFNEDQGETCNKVIALSRLSHINILNLLSDLLQKLANIMHLR